MKEFNCNEGVGAMEDIKRRVHTCFHCGNTGLLKYIGKTHWENSDFGCDNNGDVVYYNLIEHEDWHLFECPVCNKPVLISEYALDAIDEQPIYSVEYPTIAVSQEGVPKDIYTAYESSVKTKGIDHAICLLSLRRVLEMICKDKQAKGHNLERKIEDLIEKKILPPMIGDACWIIRQMGNDAAHADKVDIFAIEVDQVIGYVATIIDYLYSMPFRVSKMKQKIEDRKNKNK